MSTQELEITQLYKTCAGGVNAYQYIYDVFMACTYAGSRHHVIFYMHFTTVSFCIPNVTTSKMQGLF